MYIHFRDVRSSTAPLCAPHGQVPPERLTIWTSMVTCPICRRRLAEQLRAVLHKPRRT